MIRDIKRNSQGIIISTQLDNLGDDYSYIPIQKSVRKFNQNTIGSNNSNFNEVYDDRITDIEFEESKISDSYIFLDSTGKEIQFSNVDSLEFTFEVNEAALSGSNTTSTGSNDTNPSSGGTATITTSANGSAGMLTSADDSAGMINP